MASDSGEPRDRDAVTFDVHRELGTSGHLPLDVLPPEAIERLRSGGELTESEMDLVRRAALENAGVTGRLVGALIDSGTMEAGETTRRTAAGEIVTGERRTFTWTPSGDTSGAPQLDPQTYFELLSGQRDPNRDFFIGARRLLDIVSWLVAIAIPVGLVALGAWSGESQETVFFMGLFGLIIGVMIRKSMPRSLFH